MEDVVYDKVTLFCPRDCIPSPLPPATVPSGMRHRTKSGTHMFWCLESIRVTLHPSSAGLASGTSTEPLVASPDRKMVFKASSTSSVPLVLLHCLLRRPSPATAYIHANVNYVTQRFETVSVTLCVNCVFTSHTGSALAYPAVWLPSWQCYACSLPSTSIPTQPMMAMTSNTNAPTVLPPTTNMNCLFPLLHSQQPPLAPSLMLLLPTRT